MQQIPFIDLFKSALHVSSDKFAHPQEHFWLYIQLLVQYNAPTLLQTGDTVEMELHGVPSQPCHWSATVSVHCAKSCIYSQKCSWGWANLSLETCRVNLKRPINGIFCILLVACIIVSLFTVYVLIWQLLCGGTVPCNLLARYRCFGMSCCLVSRVEECCIGRGTNLLQNVNTFLFSTLVMNKECKFETSEPLIPLSYHEIRGSLFLCNV
jgi:hypothetical protein